VADPLDACPVLWKVIPAMMAPVIGTDADVDGSDQAAYLRYASDVVEVVETYCGDRARLMPSLMSDLDGNRLAQGLSNG
jgi:hypothetical protein